MRDTAPLRPPAAPAAGPGPVCSHTEWDPLEEVIVGIVDGARFPPAHPAVRAVVSEAQARALDARAGEPFPPALVARARAELDELARILTAEGVRVRRPAPRDHGRPYGAPGWTSTGLYDAMPRDAVLVVGDQLLECPMAWRARYHAASALRPLLKAYFRAGAAWVAAPRPELGDELYTPDWRPATDGTFRSVLTEHEPTFDAADVVRCGRDLFVQRSHVTNAFGIAWLARHLGPGYRVHELALADEHPMHIDASLLPLAPGRLLVNPARVPRVPPMFAGWEILPAPPPVIPDEHPLYLSSKWLNVNLLSLDERRVIVERDDAPMIAALRRWGFQPIPCPFRHFNSFGGSFHCATLDVRRRGALQSYF